MSKTLTPSAEQIGRTLVTLYLKQRHDEEITPEPTKPVKITITIQLVPEAHQRVEMGSADEVLQHFAPRFV